MNKMKIMKKYIIVTCMFLWSMPMLGQTHVSVFQLIKNPVTELYVDSLVTLSDSIGDLGNIFGDSVQVSAVCKVSDTSDVYKVHFEIGNESNGESNIYSDSLDFSLIPTIDSLNLYRSGSVIFMDLGVYLNTDTLYGEVWLYRNNGESSAVKYYPEY